ncbi:MAG TPA: AzlC family ABC transporter permease [Alphaproteobacteria bacterium]
MTPSVCRSFASSFRAGAVGIWPLLPSPVLYGLAFGLMAGTVGLSLIETTVFSGAVFAGGAQIASLQGWSYPVSLLFVCLTTAAINSRYVLMGATLRPVLTGHPPARLYGTLFFLVDQDWILVMRDREKGFDNLGYLLGSGVVTWSIWVACTMAGRALGGWIPDPRAFGVDFMLGAFFATVAVAFWRQSPRLAPFVVSAAMAIAVQKLWQGPWYILVGALAGSLAGVATRDRAA